MSRKNTKGAKLTKKQAQSIISELRRTTDSLIRRDLADWRAAWQSAINVDSPSRLRLYDIYRDCLVDLHLSGCIEQRRGFVLSRSFKLVDDSGDKDEEATHLLDQSWFKDLLRHCLDANLWGHSLIELGDIVTDGDGCISFSGVELIPRKHVVPEFHRIVPNIGMGWRSGYDYREEPLNSWLIEAGTPDGLGLLLKAANQTIPKKNMLAFWDRFGEIFGMPMRIARTTSRDPKERAILRAMIEEGANNLGMVTGMDTEIQFVETGKSDAYNVYDRRIDRANSEISKLIIGQTMTIEDGSSLSQSQTHLAVFENLVEADRDMLRDIVNNQLLPRMVRLGFPVKGLRFEWDDAVDYTPEQQIAYETMIADRYEVDPSYFADKYGMPVGQRKITDPVLPPVQTNDSDGSNDPDEKSNPDKGKQNLYRSFFD